MIRNQRRVQALLAVAALGAAGMFLGGKGWLGIDFGPVGAAVLYVALWAFVIYLAKYAGEGFPEDAEDEGEDDDEEDEEEEELSTAGRSRKYIYGDGFTRRIARYTSKGSRSPLGTENVRARTI